MSQWDKFQDAMMKMGEKINSAQEEFHKLITTRKNMLDRPLKKIEDIRISKGIPVAVIDGDIDIELKVEDAKAKSTKKLAGKIEQAALSIE
jgi:DNA anti-recombination protein RmuC